MQLAYNRAKQGTRAAKWINPEKNELLIPDRESAYVQIRALEKQLKTQLPKHKRAELLIARAMIFEALGTPEMVKAAQDAWNCSKTAITAHLMAVGYHHVGDLKTACSYYEQAFRYPHEEGFNIDLAYTQALLFQGRWSDAHKQTLKLKKRMVYAAYLPEWDGQSKEVSVISEGGFGDIIHTGRWLPILRKMGVRATVYLPPMFFESGFVDLMKKQEWCPEIKSLLEVPQKVPAIGFFDFPARFDVQPNAIPPSLTFKADPSRVAKYKPTNNSKKLIGFCWAARAMETPLCPSGVYRALTDAQADRILSSALAEKQSGESGSCSYRFVKLQKGNDELLPLMSRPVIESWEDTAAIIETLDAVVTVDTAVAHLAAAMNKPCYVLLSGALDWKFGLHETECPWYPSMRLFKNNGWGFDKAVDDLIHFLNKDA